MIKNHTFFFFILSLITIFIYHLLIKHNIADETMLYSWAWIINFLNVKLFFIILVLICALSFVIARIDFKIKDKYFLIFIFILAFVLSSLLWSAPDPNPDVVEFFGVSKYVEQNGLVNYFTGFGTQALKGYRFHSLLPIIGLAFSVFGESIFLVHFILSLLYAFIPVLTFLLAKKLFNRKIAVVAAFFVLSMPNMLVQSYMFMVDISSVFFVLLALLSFYLFLHKKKIYYYPLTLITFLFALTSKRPAILFLILSLPVLFIIVKRSNGFSLKKLSMKSFILFYSIFVLLFILVFLKLDFFSNQIQLDISQMSLINNAPQYVTPESYFFQIQPLIIILFLISIVFFIFKPKLSYLFLLTWIFFPYLFIQSSTIRYMLPAFPAIAITAATLLSKFKKPIITFVVAIIFLSSTLSVYMGFMPLLKNEFYINNVKQAANYVDGLDVESVGVYIHTNNSQLTISPKVEIYGYAFDYYSDKRIYYDVSESVKKTYHDEFSRFNILDYYKDVNYLEPNYDLVVVFSNIYDWQSMNYSDVKFLKETIDESYSLDKTFAVGNSGASENRFAFIYLKN